MTGIYAYIIQHTDDDRVQARKKKKSFDFFFRGKKDSVLSVITELSELSKLSKLSKLSELFFQMIVVRQLNLYPCDLMKCSRVKLL